MAYATKYKIPFLGQLISGNIYLKKDSYTGSIIELTAPRNSLEINTVFEGWFNPVLKQNISFEFINESASIFQYIDLMELEERDFQVVVEATNGTDTVTLFDGWINSEIIEQKYLHKSIVTLTATNYLSKLEHFNIDSIETLTEISLMDLILESLEATGKTDNVYLNNHLLPVGYNANGDFQSGFSRTAIFSELFWRNNVERYNALEIIIEILKAFDCYLYWWDGKWWIERYREIYQSSIYAYNYTMGFSYTYGSATTRFLRENTIADIHSMELTDQQQTISAIPGLSQLNLNLNQKEFFNLVEQSFADYTESYDNLPDPDIRKWHIFDDTALGNTFQTQYGDYRYPITNIGLMTHYVKRITSELEDGAGTWHYVPEDFAYHHGISTKFRITRLTENTEMKIEFKYIGLEETTDQDFQKFYQPYYLRIAGSNSYIYYNPDLKIWDIKITTDPKEAMNWITRPYGSMDEDPFNRPYTKFTDLIPISEVANMVDGNYTLILNIGFCLRYQNKDNVVTYHSKLPDYTGDVVVTCGGNILPNLIEAKLDNNVYNKKNEEIELFDTNNFNYKNAILTAADYDVRTELWQELNETAQHPLAEWLIYSKFQLYNRNRKKITANVRTSRFLRPFELFYDSADSNRKYILTTYDYTPEQGVYKAEFLEYDNEEIVTLNET